jgi:hypothetical protein
MIYFARQALSKKLQFLAGICVFVAKSYKIVIFPGRNVSAKDAVPGKVIFIGMLLSSRLLSFS